MSRFSKANDFTLVNNFTINHADKLSDGRHFMSTCVPQGVWLDLYDIGRVTMSGTRRRSSIDFI